MHFKSGTQSFFSRYCPSAEVSKHFEDVTQQFLCGMTIKPLQGYFGALFNVNQRLQNPGIKESLKDIEQENNENGGGVSISILHSWKQKGFSAFPP